MKRWLDQFSMPDFPPTSQARDPFGLLAIGGPVKPLWLDQAYRRGIFPWNGPNDPRCWHTPNPRAVITANSFHIPKSVKKLLKKPHRVTCNLAFTQVMQNCAAPRDKSRSTWISQEMIQSYSRLHAAGRAFSGEHWNANGELIGGFYGLMIGRAFFGESMFSHESNASKIAFATIAPLLFEQGIELIDCQMKTPHLAQFGIEMLEREKFESILKQAVSQPSLSPLISVVA